MEMAAGLAALVDPADLALIVGAAFASAFVSGVAGFGGSFLLAIVLTPIVGPKAVVPLIAVYALCANIGRLYFYRRAIRWRLVAQFILASLPGLAVGAAFLKWVPETVLLAIFGLVLLAAIPLRRLLKRLDFKPTWQTIAVIGFVFGAISGTAVGSGMFVIAALNTFGLHGVYLMGTDAAIGIINALSRVVTFWVLGLLDLPMIVAGLLMGLVTLPASWLASLLVARLGQSRHSLVIEVVILLAGLGFVASALSRLFF